MKDFELTLWTADCSGNKFNCEYPHKHIVTDIESLKKLIVKDHVFICFKNNYRLNKNFEYTDVLVVECDNEHTEKEQEWITPEMVEMFIPDVTYITYTSRHNMKQKGKYSPRPRFHIIFFIERITDRKRYEDLLKMVHTCFPYCDDGALDAARFFFASSESEVYVNIGMENLSQFFEIDAFSEMDTVIPEGERNKKMFKWCLHSFVRYGVTDEAINSYYRFAEKCSPPLDDKELKTILESSKRTYKAIAASPYYVLPEVYNGTENKDIRWVEPIPFSVYQKQPFPIDALPQSIADFVKAVSESTQTPVDMAGALSIAVLSTCLQGKYIIKGKADWYEPLNTYVLAIAPPSERKSAVMKLMLQPVNDYEYQYNIKNAPQVEGSKMQKRILERRQKAIEDQIAKGKAGKEELDGILKEITDFEEVKPMQLYVDDITTEKLVSVLSDNKGRASLISSEGGIFDTLAGIYTKNVNIDVMLKGYSGDPIRVDRIGRDSECINNPALTVLLMAQPNVVSEVLNNGTFRGRGLTARFLYCLPDSFVGERKYYSNPIEDGAYRAYEQLVFNLLEDEYSQSPETIELSPEADKQLAAFAEELEPKLIKEYSEIADWAGKLVGNILRIAGLLCRANTYISHDFLEVPDKLVVSSETMKNAIRLGRYFLNHAQAAYSVLPENNIAKQAGVILNMLREKKLTKFDRREAMRNCRRFKTVEEIQPILDLLDDYGYTRLIPQKNKGMGRPPLPKYIVNPAVFKHKTQ